MKKTFSAMELGQGFLLGEKRAYKVSPTEAMVARGSSRRKMAEEERQQHYETIPYKIHLNNRTTNIESVALSLLKFALNKIAHMGLYAWVSQIIKDSGERRTLDTFIFQSPTILAHCRIQGLAVPESEFDTAMHNEIARDRDVSLEHKMIYAIMVLADSVREYREGGRPDTNPAGVLFGFETIHVGLAGRIVQYVLANESLVRAITLRDTQRQALGLGEMSYTTTSIDE